MAVSSRMGGLGSERPAAVQLHQLSEKVKISSILAPTSKLTHPSFLNLLAISLSLLEKECLHTSI